MLPGIAPKTAHSSKRFTRSPRAAVLVGLTQEMIEDRDFLERNAVRIRYFGQPVHGMAVKTIYDSLEHLKAADVLMNHSLRATPELLNAVLAVASSPNVTRSPL